MKYSELRLFILHSIFCICAIFGIVYFYTLDDRVRLLICCFILFNLFFILFIRNRLKIFDDSLVAYSFRGIGILPFMIEFDDINSYELLSKHKIRVSYKQTKCNLYIMDATKFYQELEQKYSKYKNK